jgi:SAM-dependent MidA family methyltransferase
MKKSSSLPVPEASALTHSAQLVAHLQHCIAQAGGVLPFDAYMEALLYTPGLGYYSGGATKIGAQLGDGSDFTTAPELTPYFGRTLARQVAEILQNGLDNQHEGVIEFGAGSGKLAADIVLELDALGVVFQRYAIMELSGELRARQQTGIAQRLAAAGKPHLLAQVVWLDELPTQFSGVLLGNEVLDAMPVQLWQRRQGEWQERGVTWDATRQQFDWADVAPRSALPEALLDVVGDTDYLTETHLASEAFIRTVAERLVKGVMLMVDYGFPAHEYYHPQRHQGTVMGHYRHFAHSDPFLYPGLSDLTAHVNFTGIAIAASEVELDVLGYTTQARFLMNAGLMELLAELDPADVKTFLPISNAVQKLLSEAEMGELFKVIAVGRGVDIPLRGFAGGDRSHTL